MKVSSNERLPLFLPIARLKTNGVFLQDTLFLDPNAVLLEVSRVARKSWQSLGELIRKEAAEGKKTDQKRVEKTEAQRSSEVVASWFLAQQLSTDIIHAQNVTRLSHLSLTSPV